MVSFSFVPGEPGRYVAMPHRSIFPIAVTLIAPMLGCNAGQQNIEPTELTDKSEFIEWIEQLDSDLDREYTSYNLDDDGEFIYVDLQAAQVTNKDLSRLVRMNYLEHLNISGNEITDGGLIHIAELTRLKHLDIGFNFISDDGLQHLRTLTNLESLLLNGLDDEDQLTDKGIRHLLPLSRLKELRLNSAQITDASIETLLRFRNLKNLDVSWTNISDAGIERLSEGLPDCDIERDSGA